MAKLLKACALTIVIVAAFLSFKPSYSNVGGGVCFKYVGHPGSGDNAGACIEGGSGCSITYCYSNIQ